MNVIEEELHKQETIKEQQDKDLDTVHHSLINISDIAHSISDELDTQHQKLDVLENNVSNTKSILSRTNNRLKDLFKSDKWKYMCIIILVLFIMTIVIILLSLN